MQETETRLLLLSSSRVSGQQEWLRYAEDPLSIFLSGTKNAVFIPYALHETAAYTQKASQYFQRFGISLRSIEDIPNVVDELPHTEAIIVGGGNTFRLLKHLQDTASVGALKNAVESGIPFVGWSAGANIACPTIKTTNDMPIVFPKSPDALGLVHFQINPHYVDPDPNSHHMGETREDRILEFLEENDTPVIGLREGAWLEVFGDLVLLDGISGARIFRKGQTPTEHSPVTKFDLNLNRL